MTMPVAADALALQRLYHWERTAPERVALTQPVGGGNVKEFTWRDVMDQTRRMAAHLQGLGYEPGRADRHPGQECCALDDGGFRDLDGRLRFRAVVPDACGGDDSPDPRAQRGEAAVRRQARRLGRDEAGRAVGAAVHPPADVGRVRRPGLGRDRRARPAAAGRAGARRRRARHDHVHVGHDGDAQGRDALFRRLRVVDRRGAQATALRRGLPGAELPAALARCGAHAGRARHARERHARVLRREPRDVRRRPAAGAADRVLLGAAAVGQVPAGRAREDAGAEARPAAEPADREPDHSQESAGCPRARSLRVRRRWRSADAARPAALVRAARTRDHRGLRHDRELRRLALHAARPAATGHRGLPVRGRARAASIRRTTRSRSRAPA